MVFKDCKVQKIVSFLFRFQGGCTRFVKSCGPLAAAYCTALINSQDPSLFVNHQDSMRSHLVR